MKILHVYTICLDIQDKSDEKILCKALFPASAQCSPNLEYFASCIYPFVRFIISAMKYVYVHHAFFGKPNQ